MIRVLLADDDVLVRTGLRVLLSAEEGIEVVGEAADGEETVDRARSLRPDVVVMDVRMPVRDGLWATRQIVSWLEPRPRVLVLTTFDLDEVVDDALRCGADGFLLKRSRPEEFVAGVRVVAAGDALVAPSVTRRLLQAYAGRHRPDPAYRRILAELTERERAVLAYLAHGLSNTEIATLLHLSPETVKTHIKRILTKTGLRDRTQAVVFAFRSGFASLDDPPPQPVGRAPGRWAPPADGPGRSAGRRTPA